MKKGYLITAIIYFIVTTGLIIYLFLNREVVIKYPAVSKIEVKVEPKYILFELPRSQVDVSDTYNDADSNRHQVYRNIVEHEQDSSKIYLVTKVDVNIDKQTAVFDDSIKVKYYEKQIIKTVVDTLVVNKIKELPFYSDNWFWYFIIETFTFLSVIAVVIFG